MTEKAMPLPKAAKRNMSEPRLFTLDKKPQASAWVHPDGKLTKEFLELACDIAQFCAQFGAYVGYSLNKDKSSLKLVVMHEYAGCKEWLCDLAEANILLMQVAGEISKRSKSSGSA